MNSVFSLHKEKHESPIIFSNTDSLIITMIEQILIHYLKKKLMQVMTTEAVVLNKNNISSYCHEYYFQCQHHFSLKKLITQYYERFTTNTM